jgi:hypothetical protein
VLYLLRGEALLRFGDLARAEKDFKVALDLRPDYPPARKAMAEIAFRTGSLATAWRLTGLGEPFVGERAEAQLERWCQLRRREMDRQLTMLTDPGARPLPAIALAPPVDPESIRLSPPAAVAAPAAAPKRSKKPGTRRK